MNCSLLPAPRSLFNRAPHVARVHVGEPDLDPVPLGVASQDVERVEPQDRKSTRLNSSHLVISYAVFCLKKKNHVMVVTTDTVCSADARLKLSLFTSVGTVFSCAIARIFFWPTVIVPTPVARATIRTTID